MSARAHGPARIQPSPGDALAALITAAVFDALRDARPPVDEGPKVLTVAEAAAYLRVSSDVIYRALDRGDLRGLKVGREWRIGRASLDRALTEGRAAPED